jgi:YidC/Oxa1 family membrane protein insertase
VISKLMAGIYWVISQVMLFWHAAWDKIMPDGAFLGTNWQWILAIVFLVITVRIVLFPIFVKQIKSQRAMQVLAPQLKELQTKHKGDRETLQKETMALYQKEKVNPLMGCLPMFLQIPVFIGLFHVLRHLQPDQPESQKTLYGWTVSLFDSATSAHLFGAPIAAKFSSNAQEIAGLAANSSTVKIVAAVLVLIMITTTYLTQRQMIKKTGWNEDPQQRMIQKFMLYGVPFFTLTSGWYFPIGVIIYWVTNNLISLAQQYWVLHKYPPPVVGTGAVAGAGAGAAKGAPAKGVPAKGVPAKAGSAQTGTGNDARGLGGLFSRATARVNLPGRTGANTNDARTEGKVDGAKANGRGPATGRAIDGRALAPKPGAKPINPKKGGAPKRRSG